MEAAYKEGTSALKKSNTGKFTFFKNSDPDPSTQTFTEEISVNPAAGSDNVLKGTASVSYVINGTTVSAPVEGSIKVKNGNIDIRVKDDQGKPVGNVSVKDSGKEVGTTGLGGSLVINRVIGEKQYRIDVPEGYELEDVKVYKCINGDPGNKQLVPGDTANVTLSDFKWEIEYGVAYKANVSMGYYRLRNGNKEAVPLEISKDNTYQIPSQTNAPAKFAAAVTIGAIGTSITTGSSLNVTGVAFTIETLDKNGTPVSASSKLYASVSSEGMVLTGIPTGAVQLLNGLNTTPPASGTYADGIYYLIIGVDKVDGQTVQITKITLYMSNGAENQVSLEGKVRFVIPSTPLMR
jgi:hypothetical protein